MKYLVAIWTCLLFTPCFAKSLQLSEMQFLDLKWQHTLLSQPDESFVFLPQLVEDDAYLYQKGDWLLGSSVEQSFWLHNSKTTDLLQVTAVANPLISHTRNTSLSENPFGFFSWDGYLQYKERFSLQWDLRLVADDLRDDAFLPSLLFASTHFRKISVDVGKIPVAWSASFEHRMIFSDGFDPFWGVRIRSNEAIDVPLLRKARFEVIYGLLDEFRPRPNGYIIGMMFSVKPLERLEIMFGQTVLFGGEGAPSQNPLVFYTELFLPRSENPANRNIFTGISYRIPAIEVQPYINLYGEDCCSPIISQRTVQESYGLTFFKLDKRQKLQLNLERIRTNFITYRHAFAEYVEGNQIMGNPIGPDGRGNYIHLFYHHSPRALFKLSYAHESRGHDGRAFLFNDNRPVEEFVPEYQTAEKRRRITLESQFETKQRLSLSFKLGLERVNNLRYREGVDDWFGLAQFSLRLYL